MSKVLELKPSGFKTAKITIFGDSDLILNKMRASVADDLADKQEGKAAKARKPVNMWEHLVGSLHWIQGEEIDYTEEGWKKALKENKVGYPSSGLKKCFCDIIPRLNIDRYSTGFNASVQVLESMIPIDFMEVGIDKQLFSPQKGSPVLCYRNVFKGWSSTFTIKYTEEAYGIEEIVNIINKSGFSGGIGSHKPSSKGGSNGMFHVEKVELFE